MACRLCPRPLPKETELPESKMQSDIEIARHARLRRITELAQDRLGISDEGINIQMITTSEIKTSVVIDEKYMELAVRALHKAFDLDQQTAAATATATAAT